MTHVQNTNTYRGSEIMAIIAGWQPKHRSLETELAELSDMAERDAAARVAAERRGSR